MSGETSLGPIENIGARVRRLRTERKYSQDRLALAAHIDQSGLSKFERGGRGIGRALLTRIAQVLEIPFEQLVAGTDFSE